MRILMSSTILITIGISYLIMKKSNISIILLKNSKKEDIIKNVIFLIISIVMTCVQLLEIQKLDSVVLIKLSIFTMFSILLFYYIIMSNIIKTLKIKDTNLQLNILEGHNKNLTTINDSLKCFKHDFNNIIQVMNGYIALNDLKSLKKYFGILLEECNDINIMEKLNPEIINNPALYGILMNKYELAEKFNIKMKIDTLLLDFKFVEKNIYDISRIFGILLDNAIESAKDCKEKLVNIKLCKDNENKYLIIIENTYNNTEIDMEKIFQKNYTTKNSKHNSGLGLWEIKKILSRNTELDLFTTTDNNIFKQQLEIYQNILY